MKKTLLVTALGAVLGLSAATASAAGAGSWDLKFGLANVNPKSNNGTLAGTLRAEVNSNTRPTIGFGYWLSDNLQIDVLGAVPFSHDVRLNGADAASLKHLPPTVSLQYYFGAADAAFRPFVGAGLNHTIAFDIEERGPVAGARIDLDNSWGLAAQAGLLFKTGAWDVVADVRWIDIGLDAQLNGADIGTVNVDPLVFSVMVGTRF